MASYLCDDLSYSNLHTCRLYNITIIISHALCGPISLTVKQSLNINYPIYTWDGQFTARTLATCTNQEELSAELDTEKSAFQLIPDFKQQS